MSSTLRRLAYGAFLGTALGFAGALAFSAPAHASDGTQQPGGALGAVVEAVDQAVPDVEPTKAPEPEPTKEPAAEPEPTDEPAHDTDGQDEQQGTDEPAEEPAPADPVETVAAPVVEVVTAPVAPTPTPAPVITPTPAPTPVQTSTPTQSQPETTTVPAPTPEPQVPAVDVVTVPVDELPVVIGPVAGTATLLPGLTPSADDTARPLTGEPECTGEQPADATPDHGRGVVRTITDRRTGLPAAQQPPAPLTPCPQPPPATDQAINAVATTGHAGAHSDQYAATSAELTWPALGRLHQLRARGDVPASRTEHPEPGPA